MNEKDKRFIEKYEELLNKGYCNCNEMNCIDNNSPRKILNIVKQLEQENKALIKLVNWCEECGFGFDNLPDDDVVNWEEFGEEINGMGYIESLIYYAKKYVENEELEGKSE